MAKSSKLKDILNESIGIGGIVPMEAIGDMNGSDGAKLLQMAKQLVAKEESDKLMTKEDLVKTVAEFQSYGPSIYKKHNLAEVGLIFKEIAEASQKHVVEEASEWFDKVTVQRNMNDLKKQAGSFAKIANEAQALQDRMAALYEDMGTILNRYFTINDAQEGKSYRQHDSEKEED
jgi:hypothetical protein